MAGTTPRQVVDSVSPKEVQTAKNPAVYGVEAGSLPLFHKIFHNNVENVRGPAQPSLLAMAL
jgi:hypothetical protein